MSSFRDAAGKPGRPALPSHLRSSPVTITLVPRVLELVKRNARAAKTSVSAYVADLILRDNDVISRPDLALRLVEIVDFLERQGIKAMLVGHSTRTEGGSAFAQVGDEIANISLERDRSFGDRLLFRWVTRSASKPMPDYAVRALDISSKLPEEVEQILLAGIDEADEFRNDQIEDDPFARNPTDLSEA